MGRGPNVTEQGRSESSAPSRSSVTEPMLTVGRYAIYDTIAVGGMATVHLGRLLGQVGFARTVAIKRLHPHYAKDPEFVSMFLDEARLAARIRHPNVVQTVDVVATDTELFLVMDYVQGESLSRLTRATVQAGQSVPVRAASAVMINVLSGLHAAHEARSENGEPLGLVHRDVSPHNVLVGVDGVARVLDFGVAKAAGRIHSTRDGVLKGKLSYMAPEQLGGEVTRRTDVFSASIVLWETLVGQRLFFGADERETVGKVLNMPIKPPSTLIASSAVDEATRARLPELDAVLLRGLERDPAKRWQTAREMAVALERAVGAASAADVGEWVEQMAKEVLAKRTSAVADIESQPSVAPAVPAAIASARAMMRSESDTAVSAPSLPAEQASQASSISLSRSRDSLTPAITSKRRRILGVAIAGAAVVVAVVGALLLRGSGPAKTTADVSSARAAAGVGVPAESSAASTVPVATALPGASASSSPPASSASASATAPATATATTTTTSAPVARPRRPPAGGPKENGIDSVIDSRK